MKRELALLFLGLFLVSLAFAQQYQYHASDASGNQTMQQEREQIMARVQQRLQFRNQSLECEECNFSINGSRIRAMLSNGRNAEVKIMPEVASKRALERLRLRNCNESNNCSLELREVGKGNQTRLAYEVRAERRYKILGLFRARAENRVQIDAENGEVISEKRPWWSFLASKETEIEEENSDNETD